MLLREVEYARAESLEDALRLLSSDGARVLAGGQTLVNVMKLRMLGPDRLVDIMRVPELRGVQVDGDGVLEIGATTTYAEIAESVDAWARRKVVAEVASVIADVQVRNRGTIGGNACLNLPTSHFPPVLVAVGAEFVVAARHGVRVVAACDFFEAPFTTAVGDGEVLTRVRVPGLLPGQADAFLAMPAGRESQSIVHVAASVRVDGGVIDEIRLVLGCVGPRPMRASLVEERLVGAKADERTVVGAVRGLGATLEPVSDVNGTREYKRHVAEVLAERAVLKAARGEG